MTDVGGHLGRRMFHLVSGSHCRNGGGLLIFALRSQNYSRPCCYGVHGPVERERVSHRGLLVEGTDMSTPTLPASIDQILLELSLGLSTASTVKGLHHFNVVHGSSKSSWL